MTHNQILDACYAALPSGLSSDEVRFGIREPRDVRYIPPTSLWERIVQVFTGPKFRTRVGEVEIAIVGSDLLTSERDRIVDAVESVRPVGVAVSFVEYRS